MWAETEHQTKAWGCFSLVTVIKALLWQTAELEQQERHCCSVHLSLNCAQCYFCVPLSRVTVQHTEEPCAMHVSEAMTMVRTAAPGSTLNKLERAYHIS